MFLVVLVRVKDDRLSPGRLLLASELTDHFVNRNEAGGANQDRLAAGLGQGKKAFLFQDQL